MKCFPLFHRETPPGKCRILHGIGRKFALSQSVQKLYSIQVMKRNYPSSRLLKLCLVVTSLAAMTAHTVLANPTLADFSSRISNPADGGAGPAIWLSTNGLINQGSAEASLATFTLDEAETDFFGNAGQAFALRSAATGGAGVSGSTATPYLTGNNGSLVMTFRTPGSLDANASLIGRRPAGTVAGQPKLEVFMLAGGPLRIVTGDSQFGDNTVIGSLVPNTWYFLALSWDLTLSENQVRWHLGKMEGGPLLSGAINDVSVIGNPESAIIVSGRPNSDLFRGAYQNIAIYPRTLSAAAVEEMFAPFNDGSNGGPPPVSGDLEAYKALIESPTDGGTGPTLWFQTARSPNFGSAGQQWEIAAQTPLIDVREDFFGNPSGAFGMPAGFDRGSAISGSGGQTFAATPQGTLIMTIQTTSDVQTLASIFSKGAFANQDPFEITLFQGYLRLNYRLNEELKVGVNVYAAEPNTWYTILVRWDMDLGENAMRWFIVDMDRGIADSGTRSPLVVGDIASPVRVAGRPSSNPFFGSMQNIAVFDRALGENALLDIVAFFRGEDPAFAATLEENLPGAFWVGPGDLYSHPLLGRFRTDESLFPFILHPYFGEVLLVEGTRQPPVYLFSLALDYADCATPFGWMILDPETWPYLFAPSIGDWVYVPNIGMDGDYFWVYDYSTEGWAAFGCR